MILVIVLLLTQSLITVHCSLITVMTDDPFFERPLQRLWLFIYLIPVVGMAPALWTLQRRQQASREQVQTSRLAIALGLCWFLVYGLLGLEAQQVSDVMHFRLLFFNGIATTGYILVCCALMVRVWRRQTVKLPVVSAWASRLAPLRSRPKIAAETQTEWPTSPISEELHRDTQDL